MSILLALSYAAALLALSTAVLALLTRRRSGTPELPGVMLLFLAPGLAAIINSAATFLRLYTGWYSPVTQLAVVTVCAAASMAVTSWRTWTSTPCLAICSGVRTINAW